MGYTPKHAKPAALNTNTNTANRRYTLSALSGRRGRHAAQAHGARASEGTVAPGLRAG